MADKTFRPDTTDYENAAHAINLLSSKDQSRLEGTMKKLQEVKTCAIEQGRTSFSRKAFGRAIATAQNNAQAPWE